MERMKFVFPREDACSLFNGFILYWCFLVTLKGWDGMGWDGMVASLPCLFSASWEQEPPLLPFISFSTLV